MKSNVERKVIVIAEASSGMGAAVAKLLAAGGAAVVLGARRIEKLEVVLRDIHDKRGKAIGIKTDVSKPRQVNNLVQRAVEEFGKIDVMINNAGLMPISPVEELHVLEWNQMIDVNFKGVLYGIAAALPYMKRQKSGHIINTASVIGHTTRPGFAVYSATKSAVQVLSEGFRQEVRPYSIRITVLSPGMIDTEWSNMIINENLARDEQEHYSEDEILADSFARAVFHTIERPQDRDVNEIVFRPTTSKMREFTLFINFILFDR